MTVLSGLVVYALTWWVVLFAVLPLKITASDKTVPGIMPGAPAHPRLKQKLLLTTLISLLVWGLICAVITSNLITFRDP